MASDFVVVEVAVLVAPGGQTDQAARGVVAVGDGLAAGKRHLGAQSAGVVAVADGFVHGAVAVAVEADRGQTALVVVAVGFSC